MKKFAIAMLMITGSALAQADYRVVNADGSGLSRLCIVALTPAADMSSAATAAGMGFAELGSVRCNGLSLDRFAAKYRSKSRPAEPVAYVLKGTDDTEATALCLAVASSEQEFVKVKSRYSSTPGLIEAEIRCNGLSLKSFARKYGNPAQTISLR